MGYRIGPTHREQQRRKQGLRLMVEERLVEIGHIAVSMGNFAANLYDLGDLYSRKLITFGIQNKRYSIMFLCAVTVVAIMVLG